MNTHIKLAIALGVAMWMVPLPKAVAGVEVNAGDWKIDFSGNVNAFYVFAGCDNSANDAVVGGLACTGDHASSVRNGLLPAALVFNATTRQDDFDIDVTVGLYPGINSSAAAGVNGPGLPSALATPGIDARQVYFTFGDTSWGTVKMGRDIGLFGKDAILDDMTLLGVGSTGGNSAPSNTSLGRIGIGYIYTDWQPQLTYTTPSYSGFVGSAGIFQPLYAGGAAAGAVLPGQPADAIYRSHNLPQFQIGLSYTWGDPKATDTLSGKAWVDAVSQRARASTTDIAANARGAATQMTGTAVDGGVKLDIVGFEAVVYGYWGTGVGTTGLYVLPNSAFGERRKSDGGYIQGTYKLNRLKLGLSYGLSELKTAADETALQYRSDLVKRNSSEVLGLYYSLTKSVTLVGEYSHTRAEAWNGNSASENDVIIGGILFF
jgi:predicted porin